MMHFKISKYALFNMSVIISILYAFLPIVRAFPLGVRYLLRGLPIVLYFLCLVQNKKIKAFGNFFCVMLFAILLVFIRGSVNNANGIGEPLETIVSSLTYWLPVAQAYFVFHNLSWNDVRGIVKFCLVIVGVSSFTTIFGNLFYGTSRDLQAIVRYDFTAGNSYYIRNIGSYGFVFGIAFLLVSIITIQRLNKIHKEKSLAIQLVFILLFFCIILAEYMTAIMIGIIGLLALINKRKLLIAGMCIALLVVMLYILVPQFYYDIGHSIALVFRDRGFDYIYERVEGLSLLMSGVRVTGGDVGARLYFYQIGIDIFKDNVFIGAGLKNRGLYRVGGHSDLIDYLAAGGVVGLFPFVFLMGAFYRMITKYSRNNVSVQSSLIILCAYIIYGIVDHLFSNFEVGLTVFLIPSLLATFDSNQALSLFGDRTRGYCYGSENRNK